MMPRRAAAACAFAALAVTSAARGQSKGIALDQLDPAPAGDAFFAVPSPYARGDLVPRGLVLLDLAHDPMRLERASGATANVVAQQTFLHLDASLAIQDRLLVSALLPIALAQAGDSPEVDGRTLVSPKQAEIGDLRLGLRVRMFGFDDDPLQVGVGAYLYLPTAKSGGFAGEGSVREAPHFVAGGRFELGIPFVWTSTVGVLVRSSENPSMLTYGAGLAALVAGDHLHFGGEIHASTPLQDGSYTISDSIKVPANQTTNAELLGEVRGRIIGGLVVGVAAGPGLSHAIGTPTFRFVAGLGWSPDTEAKPSGPVDTDGDGIPDSEDACPYAFGPRSNVASRNGCPILDDDDDGIPNSEDACPNEYGPRNADPKKNGCPVPPPTDTDGDGIPDSEDACPNEKGVPSPDKTKNGCPASR